MEYCKKCPVRKECLEYSVETKQMYGLWGGVREPVRRKMIELRELKYVVEVKDEGGSPT